jgi:hypothetical protein
MAVRTMNCLIGMLGFVFHEAVVSEILLSYQVYENLCAGTAAHTSYRFSYTVEDSIFHFVHSVVLCGTLESNRIETLGCKTC